MMSMGALKMPQMAAGLPDSVRSRAACVPKALKYFIMAIAPLTRARLLSCVAGWPGPRMTVGNPRQPDVRAGTPWGLRSTGRTRRRRMKASPSGGSRYWKPVLAGMSMPGMP